jgi:uncharacterized damage-inducible protein DinB
MFTQLEQFIMQWEYETIATQRILEALTDASLAQEVIPGRRTLGGLAWHITCSIHEMMSRTGLQFTAATEHDPIPATAKDIADAYRSACAAFLAALKEQWTDASLTKTVDMYGEQWPNGLTLMVLIKHEIHHRGQMTILMRQAGLKVPGIYGPVYEEWAAMGVEAPSV